jgi:four helix bundle protein
VKEPQPSKDRYRFKNLDIWKVAQQLSEDTCRICHALPNTRSADVIARQLIRSATSVAANIAEGHGRYTLPAYINHLQIAKGSATESQGWIDLLGRLGHVARTLADENEALWEELVGAITARILSLERQLKSRQIRDTAVQYDAGWPQVSRFPGLEVGEGEP